MYLIFVTLYCICYSIDCVSVCLTDVHSIVVIWLWPDYVVIDSTVLLMWLWCCCYIVILLIPITFFDWYRYDTWFISHYDTVFCSDAVTDYLFSFIEMYWLVIVLLFLYWVLLLFYSVWYSMTCCMLLLHWWWYYYIMLLLFWISFLFIDIPDCSFDCVTEVMIVVILQSWFWRCRCIWYCIPLFSWMTDVMCHYSLFM